MNFLSLLVATLEKHNFFLFESVCLSFFRKHKFQSTALDSDYGLFIGYQMPADKHDSLNLFVPAAQTLEQSCRRHPLCPVYEL